MALRELFSTKHVTSEVEIGVTNLCNARCVHCPTTRRVDSQVMAPETFATLLSRYEAHYPVDVPRPKFLFAGSGEPLLNKHLEGFVAQTVQRGFRTGIITNATPLTRPRFLALVKAGLDELYISVQGTAATYHDLMGLDYDKVISRVRMVAEYLAQNPDATLDFHVVSSDIAEDGVNAAEIKEFWGRMGVRHLGPFPVWNRAGNLKNYEDVVRPESSVSKVNFELPAWCLVLKYKDSIDADGSFVKCECDFFGAAETYGNVHTDTLAEVYERYEEILTAAEPPRSCRMCIKSGTGFFIEQHKEMTTKGSK